MEEEVRAALLAMGFTDDEIELETTQSGNVGGFVVSARFAEQSQIERQETFWAELEQHLTPEKLRRIVSILTMAPDEVEDDVRVLNG